MGCSERFIVTSHHPAGDSAALNSQVSGRRVQPYLGGGLKQLCCCCFFFLFPYRRLTESWEETQAGGGGGGVTEGTYWKRRKGKEKGNNSGSSDSRLLQCAVTKKEVGIYRRDNLPHSSDCCQTMTATRQLCIINPPPLPPSRLLFPHHLHLNGSHDQHHRLDLCAGGRVSRLWPNHKEPRPPCRFRRIMEPRCGDTFQGFRSRRVEKKNKGQTKSGCCIVADRK